MPLIMSSPPPALKASASRSPDPTTSTPPVPHTQGGRAKTPSSYMVRSPRHRPAMSLGPSSASAHASPAHPHSHSHLAAFASSPPVHSISRSSSSSSSSSASQQLATPPPRTFKRDKLLPAVPLSIDPALPVQKSKRRNEPDSTVDLHAVAEELIGSFHGKVVSPGRQQDDLELASPLSTYSQRGRDSVIYSPKASPRRASLTSTPPRPRRRRLSSAASSTDLLVPRPLYVRAASPSSITTTESTISAASTPKAAYIPDRPLLEPSRSLHIPDRPAPLPPPESTPTLAPNPFVADLAGSEPTRKRDSTQRRLSALRGLVNNLDFNQHWSEAVPAESTAADNGEIFWACGEPSGGCIVAPATPPSTDEEGPSQRQKMQATEMTPSQPTTRRLPSSTPPRRPRLFRSSSDLLSRTPDPPRPTARQRREIPGVAFSGYSKCHIEPTSPIPTTPTSTWRASLSSDKIYSELVRTHGPMEGKRQEIMWEICETEKAFVKSMKTVLRLFATPLKTPQGKWIDGISHKVTELFDVLECVVQAHSAIVSAQKDLRRHHEVLDVKAFVATFRAWVDRLSVHEWYLLRFESVVQLVEDNVKDPESVFGEFVRMQMKEEVLGSMSLGSMLLKPVQRLTKYPLFLKRLLDSTPHPHPCQPEILSLLTLTETIILNLQATKAKADDLQQLAMLETKISGLPQGFRLAVPDRKLLGHAQVIRVNPGKEYATNTGGPSTPKSQRSRAGSLHSSRGSITSTLSSASSPWDYASSLNPFSSGTPSGYRTSAFSTTSSTSSSYYPPSRSNSLLQNDSPRRPSVTRSPSTVSAASSVAASILTTTTTASMSDWRPPTPNSGKSNHGHGKRRDDALTLLVFDDLVMIGHQVNEKGLFAKKKSEKTFKLLADSEGLGKVLDVKDWSGWQGHDSLFAMTMLPATSNALEHDSDSALTTTMVFSIPPATPPSKIKQDREKLPSHHFGQALTSLPQILNGISQSASSCHPEPEDGSGRVLAEYLAEDSESDIES